MSSPESNLRKAVKAVALFEALKGLAALLGLLGLLSLLHHDLHRLVVELIGHFGMSPHSHYPEMLVNAVDKLIGTPTHTLVLLGCAYVALRWIEAWGLWNDKAWGEWLGAVSSGIYVPLEVHHIMLAPHWQGVVVLTLNLVLIAVLLRRIRDRRQSRTGAQSNFTRGSTHT